MRITRETSRLIRRRDQALQRKRLAEARTSERRASHTFLVMMKDVPIAKDELTANAKPMYLSPGVTLVACEAASATASMAARGGGRVEVVSRGGREGGGDVLGGVKSREKGGREVYGVIQLPGPYTGNVTSW